MDLSCCKSSENGMIIISNGCESKVKAKKTHMLVFSSIRHPILGVPNDPHVACDQHRSVGQQRGRQQCQEKTWANSLHQDGTWMQWQTKDG